MEEVEQSQQVESKVKHQISLPIKTHALCHVSRPLNDHDDFEKPRDSFDSLTLFS